MHKVFVLGILTILGCTTQDPNAATNSVQIGSYVINYSFGPVFTLICTVLLAPVIVKLIERKIQKSDDSKLKAIEKMEETRREEAVKLAEERKEAARIKEALEIERHNAVIGKIDGMCRRFDKVDNRFHEHEHLLEIDGKMYRSNGKIVAGI